MLNLILPRRCPLCSCVLLPQEQTLCLKCMALLPRVRAEEPGNEVERRLFGRFEFEHATSFCYYRPKGVFGEVLRQSKFHDRPWLNARFARLFAQELQMSAVSGWPYDVDVIVPIPLHPFRLLRRGYNQSVAIAEELSHFWHLPLQTRCLYKRRFTRSQVGLSGHERLQHEEGSFGVHHPEWLEGHHVLIVDDVMTTGATIVAAADALLAAVPRVRLSVLTLAFASQ